MLTVPAATGNTDFSVRRSNTQHGEKKLTDTAENITQCLFINNLGNSGWGQRAVEAEEICGETSNVRSSHGSSVNGFSLPVIPGGSDVQAGSPDVDGGTPIREVGLCVIDSRSGDGDRLLNTGRRVVARVLVVVSGGHDDSDTAVVKLKMESSVSGVAVTFHPSSAYPFDSPVQSGRSIDPQAHRSNRGIAGPPCFFGDPVDAGDPVVGDVDQSSPVTRL